MDKRQQEIDAINKMIREQRAKLDPQVLAIAERVAKLSQNIPLGDIAKPKAGSVPYDRSAATKAIELFLKSHGNAKEFQKQLFNLLKKDETN